jgi:hypothetical protein
VPIPRCLELAEVIVFGVIASTFDVALAAIQI